MCLLLGQLDLVLAERDLGLDLRRGRRPDCCAGVHALADVLLGELDARLEFDAAALQLLAQRDHRLLGLLELGVGREALAVQREQALVLALGEPATARLSASSSSFVCWMFFISTVA